MPGFTAVIAGLFTAPHSADIPLPPPGELEIRIHGVSNTPPTNVLGVKVVERVSGDELTGFYRALDPPGDRVCEAYSWGSLNLSATSTLAALQRAGWLLLLPFALANVAYWTRPVLATAPRRGRGFLGAALTRISGLLLTGLLVAAAASVGIDLVAWQCFRGGEDRCSVLPAWVGFLSTPPWDAPARRLAFGSLLPLLVLLVLWLLSRATLQRFEETPDPSANTTGGGVGHLLERAGFWSGAERLLRLQRLHLAFGVSLVVAMTAGPIALSRQYTTYSSGTTSRVLVSLLALAAVALVCLTIIGTALLSADAPESQVLHSSTPRLQEQAGRLLGYSLILLALSFLVLLIPHHNMAETGVAADLPGYGMVPTVLVTALVIVIALSLHLTWMWAAAVAVAVTGCAWVYIRVGDPGWQFVYTAMVLAAYVSLAAILHLVRHAGDRHVAWRGAAPGVLLGAATAVALLYSTAAVVGAGNYLNGAVGVDGIIAANKDVCPAAVGTADPLCLTLAEQRPGKASAGTSELLFPGVVTLRNGSLMTNAAAPTVTDGELSAPTLYWTNEQMDYTQRVPEVRLTSGAIRTPERTMLLDNVSVNGATARVDGVINLGAFSTVPDDGFVIAVAAGKGKAVRLAATELDPATTLSVPATYIWIAAVEPIGLALTVVLLFLAFLLSGKKLRGDITNRLTSDAPALSDGDRHRRLSARMFAARAHRVEVLVLIVASVTMSMVLLALAGALTAREPWHVDIWGALPATHRLGRSLADAGFKFAIVIAAAILVLGAAIRKSESVRRSVGVAWDLTALWPRTAHPFGPPCYGERAVPDLYVRSTWVLNHGPHQGRVVFSGHSLGSVLAAAAIFRLTPDQRKRVALITYGSQLRYIFGRLFPAVLGSAVLGNAPAARPALTQPTVDEQVTAASSEEIGGEYVSGTAPEAPPPTLAETLTADGAEPRWINLFRLTDPLGARVWSDKPLEATAPGDTAINSVDRYVVEVRPASPGEISPPPVYTHGDYWLTSEYQTAVVESFEGAPPLAAHP